MSFCQEFREDTMNNDNLNLQTHFYVLNYWRAEDVSSIIRSACEAAAAPRGSVLPCPAWNSVMIRDVERSPFLVAVNLLICGRCEVFG